MNLAIVDKKEYATKLSDYITDTFKLAVVIEETRSGRYLLTCEGASDYIIGLIDGIVRQHTYPILIKDKEEE